MIQNQAQAFIAHNQQFKKSILSRDNKSIRSSRQSEISHGEKLIKEQMLELTMDNFQNDFMMIKMNHFKSKKARKCVELCQRVSFFLLVLFMSIVQFIISVFKGKQGIVSLLITLLIGLWLSIYMFYFYRRIIQKHIRGVLEYNQEFKTEHKLKHNQTLISNCIVLFVAWLFVIFAQQTYCNRKSSEFIVPAEWSEAIITNCQWLVTQGKINKDFWPELRLNAMYYRKQVILTG